MSSLKHLADALEEDTLDVGYIEPGHGMKGKQVWLVEDSDVAEMYSRFKTKQDITLWCFVRKGDDTSSKSSCKREISTHNSAPLTKRGRCEHKRS